MVYKGGSGSSSIVQRCRYERSYDEIRSRGVKVRGRQLLLPQGFLQVAMVLDDKVGEGGQDQKRSRQSRKEAASSSARASSIGRGS